MSAMMTLPQVAGWLTQAQPVNAGPSDARVVIQRVHTDTRSIEPGDLFVALRGERFDANDFLMEAKRKGAVAAICQGDSAARSPSDSRLPIWSPCGLRLNSCPLKCSDFPPLRAFRQHERGDVMHSAEADCMNKSDIGT